jgi:hypothetical protein
MFIILRGSFLCCWLVWSSLSCRVLTSGFELGTYASSCIRILIGSHSPPSGRLLLSFSFIFLALVILGAKEWRKQMNIFLRPLMEELKALWLGVDAYDNHLKCQFNLRAAYLWSIHDYLAYGKYIGWCVHGQLNLSSVYGSI